MMFAEQLQKLSQIDLVQDLRLSRRSWNVLTKNGMQRLTRPWSMVISGTQ